MFEIGRRDLRSNGSRFDFLRIGFTIETLAAHQGSWNSTSSNERFIISAMTGAKMSHHCFASDVGTGSSSQCLLVALRMKLTASSGVVCLNATIGGTSLLAIVDGCRGAYVIDLRTMHTSAKTYDAALQTVYATEDKSLQ